VLQEAKCFDAASNNARDCIPVMCKVVYLLSKGESFTETESTEVFFRACKLYQSTQPTIRKMLYFLLKEIRPKESEVFMITSSLSRDLSTSENPHFKASALRVMSRILDPAMLVQMERYIKVAIVDSNDNVASSALFLGLKLCRSHPDVVKKWVTEVQEKLTSKNSTIHFHAMLLLYEMKKNDTLALSKFFETMMGLTSKSPLAQTQLIRFIRFSLKTSRFEAGTMTNIERFLADCLKKSQDMVVYEAAKTILEHSELMQSYSITSALAVLPLFLVSSKVTTKFAGIKTLNTFALKHAKFLTEATSEYENLLSEPNRTLATMAISTLLKLSTDANVEKLLKQITNFMSDVSDDFKIELIESIKVLCLRMPHKFSLLISFVGDILKEEGGLSLKKSIVDTLIQIFDSLPSAQNSVLMVLADFIEDCIFENLQLRVIFFLGEHGPASAEPIHLIRYIYNRLILEKPSIRAAAVSALFKFGRVSELRPSVQTLLEQCLEDRDDEVRERALFYLDCMKKERFGRVLLPVTIAKLEKIVAQCRNTGKAFHYDLVLTAEPKEEEKKTAVLPEAVKKNRFAGIPELEALGEPISTTQGVSLTEKNAEFVVEMKTHVFEAQVLLEFCVRNTLSDVALGDVTVALHVEGTGLEGLARVQNGILLFPCRKIERNGEGVSFVLLTRAKGGKKAVVPAALKYKVSEYQGDTVLAVFDDEYQIENIHIDLA
jgi:coatomer subunit gamma